MTVSFEVGIGNLLPEFGANALVILCPLQPAGAITTGTLKALPDHVHHFLIIVQSDCHDTTPLVSDGTIVARDAQIVKNRRSFLIFPNVVKLSLTNYTLYARMCQVTSLILVIRSDTQEAEGAPLLRE